MSAKVGATSKRKDCIIHNNFKYVRHRQNKNGTVIWRCSKYISFHCKARLTTCGCDVIKVQQPEHTHTGNGEAARAVTAVDGMKTKMGDIGATPSSSQASVAAGLSDDVLMALPKKASLARTLRRHRQKVAERDNGGVALPPLPTDQFFEIPEMFKLMLLHDSTMGNNRVLILGNEVLLDGLGRAEVWIADGTFSVVPSIFFQLYSIHFEFGSGINPAAVYCLLNNKTQESYNAMISAVKNLVPAANPKKILVDFEKAAMTAFSTNYPAATVTGCYFHLTQSIQRKVQEVGMKVAYEQDDALRISVRCLAALAFVPVRDVADAFDLVIESMPAHDHMNELLSYFEHTYIRGRRLRGRAEAYGAALFPPPLWNQHDASISGIARTTNIAEGWHHGLQHLFQCHHPTMWTFLSGIQRDINTQKSLLLQGAAGVAHQPRKKYRLLQERVENAVSAYGRTDILVYLKAIAHLSHS